MMHGGGKSGEAIVAMKPANKAERSAAELVEPRAKAKGNAGQHGTYRAQNRARMSHALVRVRRDVRDLICEQIARKREKRRVAELVRADRREDARVELARRRGAHVSRRGVLSCGARR